MKKYLVILGIAILTFSLVSNTGAKENPNLELLNKVLVKCQTDYERQAAAFVFLSLSPQLAPEFTNAGLTVEQLALPTGEYALCGTPYILTFLQIIQRLDLLTLQKIQEYVPPEKPEWLNQSVEKTNFVVWYTTDTKNHPDDAVTQQYAQTVLDDMDKGWSTEISEWKYKAGESAQTDGVPYDKYQVWIQNIPTLGFTWPIIRNTEQSPDKVRTFSIIQIASQNKKHKPFKDNSNLLDTSAHEYHHGSQMAYINFLNQVGDWEDFQIWIVEGNAAWIGYQVRKEYPAISGSASWKNFKARIENFQKFPYRGLLSVREKPEGLNNYDACFWPYFLANNTQSGSLIPGSPQIDIMRAFWDELGKIDDWEQVIESFDIVLGKAPEEYSSFDKSFNKFVTANYVNKEWYPASDEVTGDTKFAQPVALGVPLADTKLPAAYPSQNLGDPEKVAQTVKQYGSFYFYLDSQNKDWQLYTYFSSEKQTTFKVKLITLKGGEFEKEVEIPLTENTGRLSWRLDTSEAQTGVIVVSRTSEEGQGTYSVIIGQESDIDALVVLGVNHAPATVTPGQQGVIIEQLNLSVKAGEKRSDGTITLTGLTINQTGTAADSDITTVKLLASDQSTVIASSAFTSGTATFSNLNRQITTANPDTLYLALDMAATAAEGKTIKLDIPDSTHLAVNAPDTVSTTGFPVASGVATVVPPGGWPSDPTVNVPISTAANDQYIPQLVSDGAGGAIITWFDRRSGSDDIYAQRVNASGAVLWATDGVPICTATGFQEHPQLVSDGVGGAIITWFDSRSGNDDIYAQRVNASGAVLWAIDGVPICTAAGFQQYPQLVSDEAGGAIITWMDWRSGFDVYAQRIDTSGTVLWTINGIPISIGAGQGSYPQLVSDGAGGAIITWEDKRSSPIFYDIYAQRVDASGTVLWTTNGIPICTAAYSQLSPQLVSDGTGGAIITWMDERSGNWDIYAQWVNPSGAVLWPTDGVPICTGANSQANPQLASDGAGGVIITWLDYRSSTPNIYAQRVDASGIALWTANGVPISTAVVSHFSFIQLVSDEAGGAIITWRDSRSGPDDDNIYAQRVDASGSLLWGADGVPISTAADVQQDPYLVSDGTGGAIITWYDHRNGNYDIYAQNVQEDGTLGGISGDGLSAVAAAPIRPVVQVTPPQLKTEPQPIPLVTRAFQNYPNPFNPETWLPYQLAVDAPVTLKIYSLNGRLIRTLALGVQKAGVYLTRDKAAYWDGRDDAGERVSSGVYFYTLQAGEFVATRKMLVVK